MHASLFLASLLVLMLAVGGCSTADDQSRAKVEAAYVPTASMSQAEAVAVIKRSLEEQPGSYAATNIDVSPTKLTFETGGGRLLRGGGNRATAFYFDSLGKMDITRKSKGSVVRVWDSSNVFRFHVVIPDPERAKRFMDAMTSMAAIGH